MSDDAPQGQELSKEDIAVLVQYFELLFEIEKPLENSSA